MKNKVFTMVCCFALSVSVLGGATSASEVSADTDVGAGLACCVGSCRTAPEGMVQPTHEEIRENYLFDGFDELGIDFLNFELVTASNVRRIHTTQPLDQHWRSRYPTSYMWESRETVREANAIYVSYGISLYSGSQRYWNHNLNGRDALALLNNARNQHGLWGNADLMIAFTGLRIGADGLVMGRVTRVGEPFAIVACWGRSENSMTTRHEVGHTFGMEHCARGTRCFMADQATRGNFDNTCARHNREMNAL